ncbi:hypothetical protein MTBLM1_100042 [Rhodospirillaceae bacterium LM-1]|nr:hypothetical protein MTBLM1_100042 [Rhodospirillaceae bacterium LM-1]
MDRLNLHTSGGVSVTVPANIDSITTYVLLEQEAWFEKEAEFVISWLRPGMDVIDIGANLGVYSLPMAKRVGERGGRVFAYEPSGTTRSLLEQSCKSNGLDNLAIVAAAMSDGEREGYLSISASGSELNALSQLGATPGEGQEMVRITSLDAEQARHAWAKIDFVKIDAEGEEVNILRGGQDFFTRHSPLVMFEIKSAEGDLNEKVIDCFIGMGYQLFSLLPGSRLLVPHDAGADVESLELNLFAAKPDRQDAMRKQGFLIAMPGQVSIDGNVRRAALNRLRKQKFARSFANVFKEGAPLGQDYLEALAGYAIWRDEQRSLPDRYAALLFSCGTLEALCQTSPSFPRLSTLARVAWEAGKTRLSKWALKLFIAGGKRGSIDINEPFWPACSRYDLLDPKDRKGEWFIASVVEQHERIKGHSSYFAGVTPDLEWLCNSGFASIDMHRRHVLNAALNKRSVTLVPQLFTPSPNHLNAQVWKSLSGQFLSHHSRQN